MMDPREMTRLVIRRHLLESIANDKREANREKIERLSDRITDDVGKVILPLLELALEGKTNSNAPKRQRIRALHETIEEKDGGV